VLQTNGVEKNVFPTYRDFALDDKGSSDSQIAAAFKRKWKALFEMIQTYLPEDGEENANNLASSINLFCLSDVAKNLAAHGAKKLGIQTMGDMMSMSIQDISMRGGWALKSFNTFFDYWVGSYSSSVRSGKVLAGWISPTENGYHGVSPPSMDDIVTESVLVENFVAQLLGHHGFTIPMQRFFVANLLRHWNELIEVLQKKPNGDYHGNKVKYHNFVHEVKKAMSLAKGTDETLEAWVKEVTQGFIQKNIMSVPVNMCSEHNVLLDTRSFVEIVKGMSTQ